MAADEDLSALQALVDQLMKPVFELRHVNRQFDYRVQAEAVGGKVKARLQRRFSDPVRASENQLQQNRAPV